MVPEGLGALRRLAAAALAVAALLGVLAGAARAHPFLTRNVRVALFDTAADGRLVAYVRLTLPLLVGRGVPPPQPGAPVPPAPFTRGAWESGQAFWPADPDAIAADPQGLGRLVAEGHRLESGGAVIPGEVLAVAAHPKGHVPPFDTVADAAASVAAAPWPAGVGPVDSGYVLVDAAIAYRLPPGERRFTLSSTLSPGALGEATTTNLFVDRRDGGAVFYRIGGLLAEPVVVAPGLLEGLASFFAAGVAHILGGLDHLLFLVCLVAGAGGLAALAGRITGFTLGHSITLVAGYFGVVPQPPWFAAGIEAAIAATILLAAGTALAGRGGRGMAAATLAIGLVHGFGFSFSLRDLLAADGPRVIPALAGFNLGVEAGQLAVALAVALLFRALARRPVLARRTRTATLAAAAMVAMAWLVERVPAVWLAAIG